MMAAVLIHPSHLTQRQTLADTQSVPEKERTGFGDLIAKKRTHRAMRFFFVRMSSCAFNGWRWRGSLRACWFSFLHQFANPVICRPPRLAMGRGSTAKKDHIMTTTSTTTPTQSQIITRLAGQADALGALLTVIGILPAVDYQSTLATCSRLAADIAGDLAALVRGAA